MATKGFNFRITSGFVTDLGNDTYALSETGGGAGDDYPVTRNGVTFGWTNRAASRPRGRDRNSGIDAKLAGINFTDNDGSTQRDFRIDLAGNAKIRLALGDADTSAIIHCDVRDSVGSKFTRNDGNTTGAQRFFDAAGSLHASAAAWVSSNAQSSEHSFTGHALIRIGSSGVETGNTALAHVEVEQTAAAGEALIKRRRQILIEEIPEY